ncbi:hypothetical protein [Marinilabilia sp.]|nr:hypothetical protein [Marinilabilia sp.]
MPLRYAALPAKKLRRVEVVLAVGLQIRQDGANKEMAVGGDNH